MGNREEACSTGWLFGVDGHRETEALQNPAKAWL